MVIGRSVRLAAQGCLSVGSVRDAFTIRRSLVGKCTTLLFPVNAFDGNIEL
jgi:hypothetical protein